MKQESCESSTSEKCVSQQQPVSQTPDFVGSESKQVTMPPKTPKLFFEFRDAVKCGLDMGWELKPRDRS